MHCRHSETSILNLREHDPVREGFRTLQGFDKGLFLKLREIRERNRQVYFGRSLPTGDQSWIWGIPGIPETTGKIGIQPKSINQNLPTTVYLVWFLEFSPTKIYQCSYHGPSHLRFYQSMDPIMMTCPRHRPAAPVSDWTKRFGFFFSRKKKHRLFRCLGKV